MAASLGFESACGATAVEVAGTVDRACDQADRQQLRASASGEGRGDECAERSVALGQSPEQSGAQLPRERVELSERCARHGDAKDGIDIETVRAE